MPDFNYHRRGYGDRLGNIMTPEPTREECKKMAERFIEVRKAFLGKKLEKYLNSSLYAIAQALLESYKREDNHECICKGCGNRLLIADAAPSWDALSPEQHKEINTIVARLAEPYLKRGDELEGKLKLMQAEYHRAFKVSYR